MERKSKTVSSKLSKKSASLGTAESICLEMLDPFLQHPPVGIEIREYSIGNTGKKRELAIKSLRIATDEFGVECDTENERKSVKFVVEAVIEDAKPTYRVEITPHVDDEDLQEHFDNANLLGRRNMLTPGLTQEEFEKLALLSADRLIQFLSSYLLQGGRWTITIDTDLDDDAAAAITRGSFDWRFLGSGDVNYVPQLCHANWKLSLSNKSVQLKLSIPTLATQQQAHLQCEKLDKSTQEIWETALSVLEDWWTEIEMNQGEEEETEGDESEEDE